MPYFQGKTTRTPFGRNVFLRSTRDVKTDSYTVAASTIPAETIDSNTGQKVLQPGTVLAKITSGADSGKVGPFQGGLGVNEDQTLTRTSTGGTITLTFDGETTGTIPATAAGFTAAAVLAALNAIASVDVGDVVVTGSAGGPLSVTFSGPQYDATDVPLLVVDNTSATGGTIVAAVGTAGAAPGAGGPSDGRADPANIVGLNNTFLPWQLMNRDVEVAVIYECTAVQAWCIELDASGARQPLSNATANAMRGGKGLNIMFK